MNKANKNNIENEPSPVDSLRIFLKQLFPNMKSSIIEKNVDFTILLEWYTWINIHWIENFLDNINYTLEGIKFINTDMDNLYFSELEEKKIISWKNNIWLKVFYKKVWYELEFSLYFIIAKKQNQISIEWVGEKVRELIPNKESSI